MMRRLLSTSLIILGLMSASVQAEDKDKMCDGNFVNPISDICWECIFPMSIGDVSVFDGDAPDTDNPSMPLHRHGDRVLGAFCADGRDPFAVLHG